MRSSMDRSLLLDGKQWRSKTASTAATNFQRTSGHLRVANRLVSVRTPTFTSEEMAKIVEAYNKFGHDAEAAAIQSEQLESLSRENRARAAKVAELYRQFLGGEDSVSK
jgi:hypothetical protein